MPIPSFKSQHTSLDIVPRACRAYPPYLHGRVILQRPTNFEEANVNLTTLSNYTHLLEQAVDSKYITDDELTTLEKWRKDPANWNN